MSNTCYSCGVENNAGAKTCESCKKPLKEKPATARPLTLPLNSSIGKYIIRGLVTITDMGAVYLAEETGTSEIYALKELCPSRASSEEEKEYTVNKFVNESILLQKLNFISVPRVREYFIAENNHYMAMEFIEGLDMENMVKTTGTPGLPQEHVIKWGIQICEVLDYLHNCDPIILYRDLKPANIMIRNSDNSVVLIDFGIALSVHEDLRGSPRTKIGTMGYMAPEQFHGKVSPASDVFSLGATLYYALTGQVQQLFSYIPTTSIVSEISDELDNIIRSSLETSPARRFSSAAEMKRALENLAKIKEKQDEEIKKALVNIKPDISKITRIQEIKPVMLTAIELRKAEDPEKKLRLIKEMEQFKDPVAIETLIHLLIEDEHLSCCIAAAGVLGKLKDPSAIETLIELINEPETEVELVAASIESLSNFNNDEKILKCLFKCLKNKSNEIRKASAIALENIGDARAVDVLIKARKKEGFLNREVRKAMDSAIKKLDSSLKDDIEEGKQKDKNIFSILLEFVKNLIHPPVKKKKRKETPDKKKKKKTKQPGDAKK